uniref:Ovule protein n=1 Tax=Parastrongyloides trichosuri TaxID=131310 RepID=A0A0N4ZWM0_PARTI
IIVSMKEGMKLDTEPIKDLWEFVFVVLLIGHLILRQRTMKLLFFTEEIVHINLCTFIIKYMEIIRTLRIY